tara:strand:+ start:25 stop:369 length:345 start_codon:yes stop_codon:yes gene_type:complete
MSNESENKEEEESKLVAHIEAKYEAPMSWEIMVYHDELIDAGVTIDEETGEIELRLEDIADVHIKHGECTIELKNGNTINLGQGNFGETDYKWPENVALYSEGYDQLAEGKDFD